MTTEQTNHKQITLSPDTRASISLAGLLCINGVDMEGLPHMIHLEASEAWALLAWLHDYHRNRLYKLSQHQEPVEDWVKEAIQEMESPGFKVSDSDPERLASEVASARQEYQRLLQEQRGGMKPLMLRDTAQIVYQEFSDELAMNSTDEEGC